MVRHAALHWKTHLTLIVCVLQSLRGSLKRFKERVLDLSFLGDELASCVFYIINMRRIINKSGFLYWSLFWRNKNTDVYQLAALGKSEKIFSDRSSGLFFLTIVHADNNHSRTFWLFYFYIAALCMKCSTSCVFHQDKMNKSRSERCDDSCWNNDLVRLFSIQCLFTYAHGVRPIFFWHWFL